MATFDHPAAIRTQTAVKTEKSEESTWSSPLAAWQYPTDFLEPNNPSFDELYVIAGF